MKYSFRQKLLFPLIVFFSFCTGLHAALKIVNATIVAGSTMARGNNCNVCLRYVLKNTGTETARVQLVAEPLEGDKNAIYTKNITLYPKSSIADFMPFFMTDSERYLISLIHQGQRVDKEEFAIKNYYGAKALKAAFLNDGDQTYSLALFRKNPGLDFKINEDLFRAEDIPGHWGFFQDYAVMVLVKPDFSRMSASALMALRDYVQQGGVMYLASPEASSGMRQTALDGMLPAVPTGISELAGLGFYRKALNLPARMEPQLNEYGEMLTPFLASYLQALPREGTVPMLAQDGNPLAYVRNYGLGMVVQLTVNPFAVAEKDKKLGTALWNAALSWPALVYGIYLPGRRDTVNAVLQNLQGYKIPSVRFVMKLFWFYVLAGLVLLVVLLKKKKVILGWCSFCGLGIIMTGVIFHCSQDVARDQPEKSVVSVTASAETAATGKGPLLAVGNLISKKDSRPDVVSEVQSSGYYPQKKKWGGTGAESALGASPLRIQQDEKFLSLPKIALQQLRPRTLRWTCSSTDYGQRPLALPRLILGKQKAEFVPWKYSGKMNRAMLLLPGEIRSLSISGDMIADRGGSQIETDVVLAQAQQYLRGLNLQQPALAILQIRSNPELSGLEVREKDAAYVSYEYHFELIPLDIRIAGSADGKIWYGTDMMRMEVPSRSDTRQFFKNGSWQEVLNQAATYSNIVANFCFLPGCRMEAPEKIRVYLDIVNPSGKCQFQPMLLKNGGGELQPAARKDQCFEFTGEELNQAINPVTGRFQVRIKVTSREEDGENVQRMNHWKILRFQAEALGRPSDAVNAGN